MKVHCDGRCWFYPDQNNTPCECEGRVVKVEVLKGDFSWGQFNYCERAIKDDEKDGFVVKILDSRQ